MKDREENGSRLRGRGDRPFCFLETANEGKRGREVEKDARKREQSSDRSENRIFTPKKRWRNK